MNSGRDQHVDLYESIGRAVFRYRTEAGISQAALAVSIGLKRTSISNIEKGRQKMLVHTLLEIAEALSVDPNDLLPSNIESQTRFSGPTSAADRARISAIVDSLSGSHAPRSRKAQ